MDHLNVGNIMVYEWKRDRSVKAFFQVVKKTERTVVVWEVETVPAAGAEDGSDLRLPKRDSYRETSQPLRKRVPPDGTLRFRSGEMLPWDGRPIKRTWYNHDV
jgi:hypothetical protein